MSNYEEYEENGQAGVLMPVHFMIEPSAIDRLKQRAKELDDEESGQHLAEYTLAQALLLVFHQDVEFLWSQNILTGWVFEPDTNLWDPAVRIVPEGTPEDHIIIEEEPV